MQKIEDIKRPVKKGELFLVPCIVKEQFHNAIEDEQLVWMDLIPVKSVYKVKYITPVINHPHSDKENGQNEIHYHADYRFLNRHSTYGDKKIFKDVPRPQVKLDGEIEYFVLPVLDEFFYGETSVNLISKSKIKHDCIHKGKCPHRGFDLSQVKSLDGKIKCPLHGLTFDSETRKIIR